MPRSFSNLPIVLLLSARLVVGLENTRPPPLSPVAVVSTSSARLLNGTRSSEAVLVRSAGIVHVAARSISLQSAWRTSSGRVAVNTQHFEGEFGAGGGV